MENQYQKIYASGCNAPLKIQAGHFATNHSHVNYYLDMTTLRTRISEAQEIAKSMANQFLYDTPVDTIVCLEGTHMVGGFLAEELTKSGMLSTNAHQTMYVVTPEFNSNSQMVFRDNLLPMIKGKNVVLLMASVTTGLTVNKGVEAIQYYGGIVRQIAAIFSEQEAVNDFRIAAIFGKNDVPGYMHADYRSCPLCQQGKKLEALVNAFGYSKL